jgi:hypothetical protein
MQIGRIYEADVIAGEPSIVIYRHVGTQRTFGPSYYGNRDSAQSPNECIHSEDDDPVIANTRKVCLPYLTTQRLHRQSASAGMTASGNGAGCPP